MKETAFHLIAFADYLAIRYREQYWEEIPILKMNTLLYFCFAYWGAYVKMRKNNIDNIEIDQIKDFSEYLFDAEFKAGVFGPYIESLPTFNKKYVIQYEKEEELYEFIVRNQYGGKVYKLLDPLIRDLFEVSEYDLMDISKKDEEYKRARDNNYGIMNNENITDEYCKTMF